MDTIFKNCLMIRAEDSAGMEVFYCAVQRMNSFFYANYGLLDSMQPEWKRWGFEIMTRIFERLFLNTNMKNMLGMV